MRLMLVVALAAALAVTGPTTASAAPQAAETTVVQGSVIRLESLQDPAAMASMQPGGTVSWQIGVSASADDGTIELELDGESGVDAFSVAVVACDVAFVDGVCEGAASTLVDRAPAASDIALGDQRAADVRWYLIDVRLDEPVQSSSVELRFTASGLGESVDADGEVTLPATGTDLTPSLLLALVPIVVGIVLAGLARRSRRHGT